MALTVMEKVMHICDYLENKHDQSDNWDWEIMRYHGIADNGADDKTILIAANWNNVPPKILGCLENLERESDEFETGWCDEYTMCDNCYKAIRTQPTHYGWLSQYLLFDGGIICGHCLMESLDDYLEYFINNADRAITVHGMAEGLEKRGWTCLADNENYCARYETGFHHGQTDDPQRVADWVRENLPNYDFIFDITSVGQFDIHWRILVKKREENE